MKIRNLVRECKYTNPDEHIIDAFFGSNNPRVQSKLLEHDDTLTLDKAVNITRTQEDTNNQLQDIMCSQITAVDALKHGPYFRVKQPSQEQSKDWPQRKRENIHAIDTEEPKTETSPR